MPFLSLPLYVHDWVLGKAEHTHCLQISTTSWLSFTSWHGMCLVMGSALQETKWNSVHFWVNNLPGPWEPFWFWEFIIVFECLQFSSVQLLSCVWLFVTPRNAELQALLSFTSSWSLPKLMSIESVMLSNHLMLCHPLLLLPPVFPCVMVFSNESALHIRWPEYWSFSFDISLSNEHPRLISFRMDWLDLLAGQETLKSLLWHHSSKASIFWHSAFFIVQLSYPYVTTGKTIALTRRTFIGK